MMHERLPVVFPPYVISSQLLCSVWLDVDAETVFIMYCDHLQEEAALIKASKYGDAERVSRLLTNGHDPTVRDSKGRTPYQLAANKEVGELIHTCKSCSISSSTSSRVCVLSFLGKLNFTRCCCCCCHQCCHHSLQVSPSVISCYVVYTRFVMRSVASWLLSLMPGTTVALTFPARSQRRWRQHNRAKR